MNPEIESQSIAKYSVHSLKHSLHYVFVLIYTIHRYKIQYSHLNSICSAGSDDGDADRRPPFDCCHLILLSVA